MCISLLNGIYAINVGNAADEVLAPDRSLTVGREPYRPDVVAYGYFLEKSKESDYKVFRDFSNRQWLVTSASALRSLATKITEIGDFSDLSKELTWCGPRDGLTIFRLHLPEAGRSVLLTLAAETELGDASSVFRKFGEPLYR